MAALYLLSSVPGDQTAGGPAGALVQWITPAWQNLLHVPLYAGLAASWLWALASYPLRRPARLTVAFLLTVLWAILDETHQMAVPGRYASLTDLALNTIGATLAVAYSSLNAKRT